MEGNPLKSGAPQQQLAVFSFRESIQSMLVNYSYACVNLLLLTAYYTYLIKVASYLYMILYVLLQVCKDFGETFLWEYVISRIIGRWI